MDVQNNERLCKLGEDEYVVCPSHCCGEFWESGPRFCCDNNFKPIRNLFFFLATTFVALFATIVVYLVVENSITSRVTETTRALGDLNPNSNIASSEDASLDEDYAEQHNEPAKKFLLKHSQSFKDMSKLHPIRRLVVR